MFNRDSVLAYKEGKEPEATQKLQDLVNRYIAGFSFLTKYCYMLSLHLVEIIFCLA